MSDFENAVNYVLENEGGLSIDPTDHGGVTNFGISKKFIESLNDEEMLPIIDKNLINDRIIVPFNRDVRKCTILDFGLYIKELNPFHARIIYKKYFWLPIYEKIEDQHIADYIFDMHVQHGASKAAELVQRAINASCFNHASLKLDGKLGHKTLAYINLFDLKVNLEAFMSCLICVRESLFRCIVAHDKTQEDKLEGWLKRCYR